MVIRYALTFLLLMVNTGLNAQPAFSVSPEDLHTGTIELGKPFQLRLYSSKAAPSLQTIDLSEIRKDFYVDTRNTVDISGSGQQWLIRLYPLKTGVYIIPSLQMNGVISKPVPLTVTAPVDPRTGKPINIQMFQSVDPGSPVWVRQQIVIRYAIHTDSRYSQFKLQDAEQGAHDIKPFALDTQQVGPQDFLYQSGWVIHPKKHGHMRIELPALHYINDGVTTHIFYRSPFEVEVQPLPLYVPATMPVGLLKVQTDSGWLFNRTGSLAEWQFTINGTSIPANWLPTPSPALLRQAGLHTYPVNARLEETFNTNGIQSIATYRIPFKNISQGVFSSKPVSFAYFNPGDGTIHSIQLQLPLILSLYRWLTALLAVLVVCVCYLVLKSPVSRGIDRLRRYRLYRRTLSELANAETPLILRQCIRRFAMANGLSENTTIGKWLQGYHRTSTKDRQQIADIVNSFFYNSSSPYDVVTVRQHLLSMYHHS